jgi:hypothetical protein
VSLQVCAKSSYPIRVFCEFVCLCNCVSNLGVPNSCLSSEWVSNLLLATQFFVSLQVMCVCVEKKRKILVVDICLSRLESKEKERQGERELLMMPLVSLPTNQIRCPSSINDE